MLPPSQSQLARWCPSSWPQQVGAFITPIFTMLCGRCICTIPMVHKATYNWGGTTLWDQLTYLSSRARITILIFCWSTTRFVFEWVKRQFFPSPQIGQFFLGWYKPFFQMGGWHWFAYTSILNSPNFTQPLPQPRPHRARNLALAERHGLPALVHAEATRSTGQWNARSPNFWESESPGAPSDSSTSIAMQKKYVYHSSSKKIVPLHYVDLFFVCP